MVKRRLMAKRQQLSNKFSLNKCVCTAEDRISKLPDEILVHILSFLSVKEAADTCVLSKRWLPLSTYISNLNFDATEPLFEVALNTKLRKTHMNKYIRWVNRTLQMCKVERLDQFRVCFDLNKFAHHDIDTWLEFAVSRQVQRLELDLLKGGEVTRYSPYCYNFPAQHFGLNDYAAQPRLSYVHKLPPLLRNFKSLKVVLFKSVNVTGEVLEFFLYNCPYLEEMTVHGSGTLVNLEVVGPSLKLKHLSIFYCTEVESLKICDTNLVTLATSSSHKLLLLNVPMLIEVEILGRATHFLDDILPIVSCVLSQLEVLKIHADDGLVYLGKYKIPQLTMLKKFVLVLQAWDDTSFLDCTNVIEAAPQLTEFELNLLWIKPKRSKRECRKVVSCPLHHLKVVSLYGYYGRTSELELVNYFLKNGIVLEKIIVDPLERRDFHYKGYPKEDKYVRIARKYAKLQLQTQVPKHIELVIL